ncbi:MAG: hypothetical protein PHX21_13015 [bacterium]|nr:hypothetical protein [bacterium]
MGHLQQVSIGLSDLTNILNTWQTTSSIRTGIEPIMQGYLTKYPNSQIMVQYKTIKDKWIPLPSGFTEITKSDTYRIAIRASKVAISELVGNTLKQNLAGLIAGVIIGLAASSALKNKR